MKTSNKWLLAALLLLLGSLTAFNMGLRAEYRTGAYKNPNYNTTALNFKDFTEIDLQAANVVGLKVVAGPYAVRLNKDAGKYVKVTQQGQRLRIAVVFPNGRESVGGRQALTISLPQLARLSATSTYLLNGKPTTDKYPVGLSVRIEGFRQDSLQVLQDHGAQVELARNQLGFLRAEAGRTPGSHPQLRIESSNRIGAAFLRVQSEGQLQLEAGGIANLRTQFGDSAKANLAGAGLQNLGQR